MQNMKMHKSLFFSFTFFIYFSGGMLEPSLNKTCTVFTVRYFTPSLVACTCNKKKGTLYKHLHSLGGVNAIKGTCDRSWCTSRRVSRALSGRLNRQLNSS